MEQSSGNLTEKISLVDYEEIDKSVSSYFCYQLHAYFADGQEVTLPMWVPTFFKTQEAARVAADILCIFIVGKTQQELSNITKV